jgi:nucleotide-binding universal stress UspA family protein
VDFVSPFDERRRVAEPLAPRPDSLEGRTIALLDITKRRGDEFLDRIEELLHARGAHTFRVVKEIFSKPAAPEIIRRIANRGDLVVEGLAD